MPERRLATGSAIHRQGTDAIPASPKMLEGTDTLRNKARSFGVFHFSGWPDVSEK
jgi:hypothetical protein